MTTEYALVVSQMDTKPQEGELNDVVSTIHWRRTAVATEGENTYYADVYGAMGCASPSDTDFTAYADLTLEAGLDTPYLDINLGNQIENQINPPIVALPLPWVTPTEEIIP